MRKKSSERLLHGVGPGLFLLLCMLLVSCRRAPVAPTRAVAAATITAPATASATASATATATATATVATTVPATPLVATVTPAGPCEIVADEAVTVYQRPSLEAGVFGTLDPTFQPQARARTADGSWIAFEPAVAQAANIGVFRLRWIEAESVRLEGGCAGLEVIEGPPPGVCFTMPMFETTVYATPAANAAVLATLVPGDYAAVTGRYGEAWASIDLDQGNVDAEGEGWVEAATLNLNGPCDLPQVTP